MVNTVKPGSVPNAILYNRLEEDPGMTGGVASAHPRIPHWENKQVRYFCFHWLVFDELTHFRFGGPALVTKAGHPLTHARRSLGR
jgi:hypothetical protein